MKHKIIPVLLLASVVMASCSKELDTTPTQSIDATAALATSNDVQVALVGAYAALGSADLYGGRAFVGPDLLGDAGEVSWSGTYQGFTQIYNKAIPVVNNFVASTWLAGYACINDANNVLGAINVVNENNKDRVQGEAEFIRGSVYFDLVRLFGKAYNDGNPATNLGVPIVLSATKSVSAASKVSRNTVADVYAQVINDLKDAEAKLPATNGFYASRYSAAAMLARVYLQKGDYANAAIEANRVIASNKFSLVTNYTDVFPYLYPPAPVANTSEDVFAMQVNTSSGFNGFQQFYSADGRGDITVNDEHLALYDAADDRSNLFYTSGGSVFTGKWDNLYGNVHIIRLAEMYLIRAEANFRLNSSVGASPLSDINIIRQRALLPDIASGSLTLDKILKERKLELAFEGFTLHDAKRLQKPVGILPYNSPKLVYPIPSREIIANPNLVQNEGYF